MSRWGKTIRRHLRQLISLAALVTLAAGMLIAGYFFPIGYPHELLVNIGAGISMVIATYIVFDPLIRDLQKPDVMVHPRLSYPAFFRNVRHIKRKDVVAILETSSAALSDRHSRDFKEALAAAFQRQASAKILLLDPDSVAAGQRTNELAGKGDVRAMVMANIRNLVEINRTTPGARELLDVRLYSITPAVAMYRWSDKAFVSFYPVGRLSYDSEQLEIHLQSSWGKFVVDRFEELWDDAGTRNIVEYLNLKTSLWYQGHARRELKLSYVRHEGAYYVPAADLGDALIGRDSRLVELHTGQLRLRLDRVPNSTESATAEAVAEIFERKYGRPEREVVRLLPIAEDGQQANSAQ